MANYLVDTHILLWTVADSAKLPVAARRFLSMAGARYFFSPVSVWEIAIKRMRHPDEIPLSASEAARLFRAAGFEELVPDSAQCAAVEGLPPIHLDPFDRLLIAQAKTKQMQFITHDHILPKYGDFVIQV